MLVEEVLRRIAKNLPNIDLLKGLGSQGNHLNDQNWSSSRRLLLKGSVSFVH